MDKTSGMNTAYHPLVSIITPTYNHQLFIAKCIKSVLAQDYLDWEQIIIDDSSTDKTAEIIRKFKDSRIRYFHQEHKGILKLADTYNKALGLCKGELIAILEGDDFWPPEKLKKTIPVFQDGSVILAYGLTREVTVGNKITNKNIPRKMFEYPFLQSVLFNDPVGTAVKEMARPQILTFTFPCSVIIRNHALKEIGGFQNIPDCPLVDYPTFINLALKGKFFFIPETMGYWRRHASGTTLKFFETIRRAIFKYSLSFLMQHASEISLKQDELNRIKREWAKSWSHVYCSQGRALLLEKKWGEARNKFRLAILQSRSIIYVIIGFSGVAAALLHKNLEHLARFFLTIHYYDEKE